MYDHKISGLNILKNMFGQTQCSSKHGIGATWVTITCSSLIDYHHARITSEIIIQRV